MRTQAISAVFVLNAICLCTNALPQTHKVDAKPELAIQAGHARAISKLAITADGRFLASASYDRTVKIWDANTGIELRVISSNSQLINDVAFSPTRAWIAVASSTLALWDVNTGLQVRPLWDMGIFSVLSVTFSNDGKLLAAGNNFGDIQLWDLDSGQPPKILKGHQGGVDCVAFSPDGRRLVSGGHDQTIRIWDLADPKVAVKRSAPGQVNLVRFSPNGEQLVSAYSLGRDATLWDATKWEPLRPIPGNAWAGNNLAYTWEGRLLLTWDLRQFQFLDTTVWQPVGSTIRDPQFWGGVVIGPEGRWVGTGGSDGAIRIWDTANGNLLRTIAGHAHQIRAVALSHNGRRLASTGLDHTVRLWNLNTGQEELWKIPKAPNDDWYSLAFNHNDTQLAAGGMRSVRLWSLETGESKTIPGIEGVINSLAVSSDGTWLAAASNDSLQLWNANTGQLKKLVHPGEPGAFALAFNREGNWLASANKDESASIWDVSTGTESRVFSMREPEEQTATLGSNPSSADVLRFALNYRVVKSVAFGPDSRTLFTGTTYQGVIAWDTNSREKVNTFRPLTWSGLLSLAISPNGHLLVADNTDGSINVWNSDGTGQPILLPSLGDPIFSIMFHPNGRCLFTFGTDGSISVHDVSDARYWVKLIPLDEPHWVAVDSDGRFDSDNLDEITGVRWLFPEELLRGLPPEIFMRDYYQPRLLPRLLRGEKPSEIRSLSSLNRAQTEVTLLRVDPEEKDGLVSVKVRIRSSKSEVQKDGSGNYLESGGFDLRLFRDGQLVAQWPETSEAAGPPEAAISPLDLESWRKLHEIGLTGGEYTHTFHHVRLPVRDGVKKVLFTAYAFNSDRVKSLTTPPLTYTLPKVAGHSVATTRRRAYLIAMGVNANQSGWNLQFAVPSARDASRLLHDKLATEYEVIDASLFSTLAPDSPRVALQQATKANLKAVLDLLAGRSVDQTLRDTVDPDRRIRPASPDDAVILFVGSHGYADPQGAFYVVPYDTGKVLGVTEDLLTRCDAHPQDHTPECQKADAFLTHTISSQDLTEWWSGVDAGEMIMILDSCHSAAAPGREFRPGPLGDAGFGQLSYDKRMRILTATQPDKTARATPLLQLGHSLLVEALVREAQEKPKSSIAEWLRRAERRVPLLTHELYPEMSDNDIQLPELFDFAMIRSVSDTH